MADFDADDVEVHFEAAEAAGFDEPPLEFDGPLLPEAADRPASSSTGFDGPAPPRADRPASSSTGFDGPAPPRADRPASSSDEDR
jgi:hypothetical protein